ncbi:MAG: hypothetical protein LBR05_06595 [Azoarcus sp.]|jgi:hypothetical protein|nr:hypothetical protein [Azoarcus sp.]
MIYVRKDSAGHVVALSRVPVVGGEGGWREVSDDDPEARAFAVEVAATDDPLRGSDLPFVRVLEDVIDLLVERGIILFTDLPPAAQTKLLQRRNRRQQQQSLNLLDDDSLI